MLREVFEHVGGLLEIHQTHVFLFWIQASHIAQAFLEFVMTESLIHT